MTLGIALVPALLLVTLFLVLSALHVYWAFGGQWGRAVAVPEMNGKPLFDPGPLACLGVAILLLVAALLCLGRIGWVELPAAISVLGVWGLVAVFVARAIGDFRYVGVFKSVRGTRFAHYDSRLYSPLCVVIAALAFWLTQAAA